MQETTLPPQPEVETTPTPPLHELPPQVTLERPIPTDPTPTISPRQNPGVLPKLVLAVVFLLILSVVGALAYYMGSQKPGSSQPEPSMMPSASPDTGGVACTMEAKQCPDGSYVGRTGPNCEFTACPSASPSPSSTSENLKNFQDPNYTISYPNDFANQAGSDSPSHLFIKRGPSYVNGSEMYDGVSVNVEVVPLNGNPLDKYVHNEYDVNQRGATANEVLTSPQHTQVGQAHGFTFGFTFTGTDKRTFTYYFLQKDAQSSQAIKVSTMVADPSNLGFEKSKNTILDSLVILK